MFSFTLKDEVEVIVGASLISIVETAIVCKVEFVPSETETVIE